MGVVGRQKNSIQDKKDALFLCPCMCLLRLQFADLFHDLPMAHKITVNQTGAFHFSQRLQFFPETK